MKLLLFLLPLVLVGCATRVQPIGPIVGQHEAVAFSSRDSDRASGVPVVVADLPEILSRANWAEKRMMHKGGLWLRFDRQPDILIPYGFEFFLVDGTPGHFQIRPEDEPRFRELTQRIQQEANQGFKSRINS